MDIMGPICLLSLSLAGTSVIVWKQDKGRIISAGPRLIRKDPRMSLVPTKNGVSLVIEQVTPDDRGEFDN